MLNRSRLQDVSCSHFANPGGPPAETSLESRCPRRIGRAWPHPRMDRSSIRVKDARPPDMQPDEIGRIIGEAILDRRLLPGRRLNELELSRLLGVSRSLVRFALLGLHHDGLVSFETN